MFLKCKKHLSNTGIHSFLTATGQKNYISHQQPRYAMLTLLPIRKCQNKSIFKCCPSSPLWDRYKPETPTFMLKSGSFLRVSSIPGGATDRLGREECVPVWTASFRQVAYKSAAMRLRLAGAVLLSAAAYYVYLPLPSGVSEPWKLMLLDALFRSFMQAVRAGGCSDRRAEEDRLMWDDTESCRG